MIGFFGGSFNPPHFGHINLALALKEKAGLKEVWFCPTSLNPFKTKDELVSGEERVQMLELAVRDIPGFKVIDVETKRPPPAYTIDTLHLLSAKQQQFRLLLGEDQLEKLATWKDYEELIKLAPPLVGSRYLEKEKRHKNFFDVMQVPLFDISSTEIRDRLKKGLFVGHLLPQAVLSYILQKGLYLDGEK